MLNLKAEADKRQEAIDKSIESKKEQRSVSAKLEQLRGKCGYSKKKKKKKEEEKSLCL